MNNENDRLMALEEEITYLRMQNEELSNELVKQWKQMDTLVNKISQLENRLAGFETQRESPEANTKPPHW